jgi:tetratricopeptide (TPR) repeat protein
MLLLRAGGHVAARLILMAAFFVVLLREGNPAPPEQTSSKPFVQPTNNLDLQLVRLYLTTGETWDSAAYEELADILIARGERDIVARLSAGGIQTGTEGNIPFLLRDVRRLLDGGEWAAAEELLQSIIAENPIHPDANLLLGLLKIPDASAVDYLQNASIEPGPTGTLAESVLTSDFSLRDTAIQLVNAGEFALADRLLTLQIDDDNLDGLAYAYRGFVRDQRGGDGINDLQTALALEPTSSLPYFFLGLHYRQREFYDLSLGAFLDAHLLDEENPALAAEVATAHQLNQRFDLAEEWYALAASLAPADARFARLQAAFYADTGFNLEEGGAVTARAAATDFPDDSSIQASWGRVLYLREDYEAAQTPLERALTLAPDDPRAQFFYGNWLEHQGQNVAALENYLAVVQTTNAYSEQAREAVLRLSQ